MRSLGLQRQKHGDFLRTWLPVVGPGSRFGAPDRLAQPKTSSLREGSTSHTFMVLSFGKLGEIGHGQREVVDPVFSRMDAGAPIAHVSHHPGSVVRIAAPFAGRECEADIRLAVWVP